MRQRIRPTAALVAAGIAVAVPVVATPAAAAEEAGPDLVVSALPHATPAPGETYEESVTLTNRGTAAADGVTFRIRLTRGLDFPEPVEGCAYSTVGDQIRQALCELDAVVEPGASLTTPVRFKALPKALMEAVEYGTSPTGEAPGEGFDESHRRLTLTADSSADLVAVGEWTEALPGDGQSFTVSLRNDGPGWVQDQTGDDIPALLVTIPSGTVTTLVPEDCAPFEVDGPGGPPVLGRPRYVCWPEDGVLEVGRSLSYTFSVKIDEDAQQPRGEVKATSVYDVEPVYDKNHANNTDQIRIDLPTDNEPGPSPSEDTTAGSGTGGGAGGDGGSGTGGGGNDPQGQAAGGSGTAGTAAGTATAAGASVHGNLADTGSDGTPLLAGAAAGAAALGGLLVMAVRRRTAAGSC